MRCVNPLSILRRLHPVSVLRRAHALSILAALILPAGLLAPAHGAEQEEAFPFEIRLPRQGETYEGRVDFEGVYLGKVEKGYTVAVRCGDTTHYILLEPDMLFGDSYHEDGKWVGERVKDPHLPLKPGPQTLTVQVRELHGAAPLFEGEVRFTVKPRDPEEAIEKERGFMEGHASALAWPKYELHELLIRAGLTGRTPELEEEIEKKTEAYLRSRVSEFRGRMGFYCRAAELYGESCQPERARQFLDFARAVFEEEGEGLLRDPVDPKGPGLPEIKDPYYAVPPEHYRGYATFHARQGDLESAAAWLQKIAAKIKRGLDEPGLPYETAPYDAFALEDAYYEIAFLCYLLGGDLDGYREWEKMALEVEELYPDPDEEEGEDFEDEDQDDGEDL